MSFVSGPVTVTVPASSANLGPGFDALGLALDLCDELTAEVIPDGLEIQVTGAGAGEVPLTEQHLVWQAMCRTFELLGVSPPGVKLVCRNRIPHARGLGSSSAAIVGGIQLARKLTNQASITDQQALELANLIEGHPDNVAPALFGGFTIAVAEPEQVRLARLSVLPSVQPVVFIPPTPLSTEVARGLLPTTVTHRDAAKNSGRTALLVAGLTQDPALLFAGTADLLHQSYRATAMPASAALLQLLRNQGHAAVISGAGPTVLVLTNQLAQAEVLAFAPAGWQALPLAIYQN